MSRLTPFRPLVTLLLGAGLALGAAPAARAQGSPAAPQGTPAAPQAAGDLFRQVFGANTGVTGKNGYEDLVLAVEALKTSKLFQEFEPQPLPDPKDQPKPPPVLTLTARRRILEERAVQRALALIRRAVAKPVVSPHAVLTYETALPELSGFRRLSRLLQMVQYVQFADGRVSDALGTARLGLRVGQVIQTDTLISGLVGIAMESITLRSVADHLDQLSARDCELLLQVCREWLAQPPRDGAFWQAELASMKRLIDSVRAAGPKGGSEILGRALGPDDPDTRQVVNTVQALSPAELDTLSRSAAAETEAFYNRAMEELQKPAWLRNRTALRTDDSSPLSWLTRSFVPAMDRAGDRFTQETAQVRMLACHAAILRYRWEKNALPPNLDTLELGELAQDPFTGQPFQYRPARRKYRLFSAGAPAESDDVQAVDGRRPISLIPDE